MRPVIEDFLMMALLGGVIVWCFWKAWPRER
jgi:hypothetical protein